MFTQNILKKTLCAALVALSFSSCKKGLDLKPTDGIVREDYWKTKQQLHAAVIGAYSSLLGDPKGSDRSLAELLFLWGELRADMLAPSLGTTNQELEVMNVNTVASNTLVNWRPLYRTINYCNTVLDFGPLVRNTDQTLSQAELDSYMAEAKTLRALMYFYLVRSFGDVPLKLTSTSSDEEIATIPKTPQAEVLAQIAKDLAEAEPKTPLTYGDNASDKGRLTRYAVNTLQADVYLWMDRYQDALEACNKVIASRRYGLLAPASSWFNALYRTGNTPESIFEFQFYPQKLNTFFDMFASGKKRFLAANRVLDQVYGGDDAGQRDLRSDGASVRAEDNVIWKYVGQNTKDLIASGDSYTHWFVYRYADILLMKAEALNELDRGAEALELVQFVRNRANALPATNTNPQNKAGIAQFILEERAREFMFEGKRWYDVLRYAKRNNYEHRDYLEEMVSNTVPANMVRTARLKMQDHNSHYFPIYEYELQTNKNLVQNPFYK
ncbi:RagB/SusD family nutrient uptake outer membrane protein [Paraflavisolibacter sp. H34]|uniref:RagB/SusD family nutrient uptake outer membrane protein n=1 Tax=Huijunlia imazamoxiresistens TaxID=3127457 RepID=UPI00301B3C9D